MDNNNNNKNNFNGFNCDILLYENNELNIVSMSELVNSSKEIEPNIFEVSPGKKVLSFDKTSGEIFAKDLEIIIRQENVEDSYLVSSDKFSPFIVSDSKSLLCCNQIKKTVEYITPSQFSSFSKVYLLKPTNFDNVFKPYEENTSLGVFIGLWLLFGNKKELRFGCSKNIINILLKISEEFSQNASSVIKETDYGNHILKIFKNNVLENEIFLFLKDEKKNIPLKYAFDKNYLKGILYGLLNKSRVEGKYVIFDIGSLNICKQLSYLFRMAFDFTFKIVRDEIDNDKFSLSTRLTADFYNFMLCGENEGFCTIPTPENILEENIFEEAKLYVYDSDVRLITNKKINVTKSKHPVSLYSLNINDVLLSNNIIVR